MSFLTKLAQGYSEDNEETLITSVINQLVILFSNRSDKYWIFDFKNHKLIALHEIFRLNYASPEFTNALEDAIKAFDSRLFDVNISVKIEQNGCSVFIECRAIYKDTEVKISQIIFAL